MRNSEFVKWGKIDKTRLAVDNTRLEVVMIKRLNDNDSEFG